MKKIIYIILALSLVTASCKNRKEAKEKAKIAEESKLPENNVEELTAEEKALEPEDREVGIAVISISRSVCFGVCPAYSAQIFKDGTLLYQGSKNVEYIGKFKGKVNLDLLNSVLQEIVSIGYFSLEGVYDNKNVTDLPTIVTYVNNKGKAKKVLCRFDCDDRLKKVHKVIDVLINNTKLTQIEK